MDLLLTAMIVALGIAIIFYAWLRTKRGQRWLDGK